MSDRHVLTGSHHEPNPDHQPHCKCHPDDRVDVTVWLSEDKRHISGDKLNELRGWWKTDLDHTGHDHPNSVRFSGRVQDMEEIFGVELHHLNHPDGNLYRGHLGPISIPDELKDIVTGVFGLDERPVARPYFRKRTLVNFLEGFAKPPAGTFTPPQLAKLYDFPTGVDGTGQTIALIELGGGFRPADIRRYFAELGIKQPQVSAVLVDGGKNKPDGPDGADGEVMLDICVAGGMAPGARIAVYFAPNTDRGFMDAVARAMHDPVHKPSVISISWGGPEDSWTAAAMQQFDAIFAMGKAIGVTVTAASGDSGSSDGETGNHVDFPASSSNVLACGGTSVKASGDYITSEVVWNDGAEGGSGGGGFSTVFARPAWQTGVPGGMRGVPDVAANASPATGWFVRVDGQDTVIGGTSAVAPAFAALIALCNQANGQRAGFVNGAFYQHPGAFNDVTSGNNGAFSAMPGWDAASGLGSPIGTKVAGVLKR